MSNTRVTILGCGSSGGVPVVGNLWGACDPSDPRNRRLRPSCLVETGGKTLLIDSGPDLRAQLLAADVRTVDAVLYTHAHGDHIHGLNDLNLVSRIHGGGRPIPIFAEDPTMREIRHGFGYALTDMGDQSDLYKPFLQPHSITPGTTQVAGIPVQAIRHYHGDMAILGYRIGNFAYSTDVNHITDADMSALEGLDLWVVDCLRERPHRTHAHLDLTLAWIRKLKPRRALLTHMGTEMDYATLAEKLPKGVAPAVDGLVVNV